MTGTYVWGCRPRAVSRREEGPSRQGCALRNRRGRSVAKRCGERAVAMIFLLVVEVDVWKCCGVWWTEGRVWRYTYAMPQIPKQRR